MSPKLRLALATLAFVSTHAHAESKPTLRVSVTPDAPRIQAGGEAVFEIHLATEGVKKPVTLRLFRSGGGEVPTHRFDAAPGANQPAILSLSPDAALYLKLTISTRGLEPGRHEFQVDASSPNVENGIAAMSVTVIPAGDFRLSIAPDHERAAAGETVRYRVAVTGDRNFEDTVALASDYGGAKFEPAVVKVARASAESTLFVPVDTAAGARELNIAVTASSAAGKVSKRQAVTLRVLPKPQPRSSAAPDARVYWTCLAAARNVDFEIDGIEPGKWRVRPFVASAAEPRTKIGFDAPHAGGDWNYLRPGGSALYEKWAFTAEIRPVIAEAELRIAAPACLEGEAYRDIADLAPAIRQRGRSIEVERWEWMNDDSPNPLSPLKLVARLKTVVANAAAPAAPPPPGTGPVVTFQVRPVVRVRGVEKPVAARSVTVALPGSGARVTLTRNASGDTYSGRAPLLPGGRATAVTISVSPETPGFENTARLVEAPWNALPGAAPIRVEVAVGLARPTFAALVNPSQRLAAASETAWLTALTRLAWRVLDEIDRRHDGALAGRYLLTVAERGARPAVLAGADAGAFNRSEGKWEEVVRQVEYRWREVSPEAAVEAFDQFLNGFSYGPAALRGVLVYFAAASDAAPDEAALKALDGRLAAGRMRALVVRLGRGGSANRVEVAGAAYRNLRVVEFDMAAAAKSYFTEIADSGIELAGAFLGDVK